MCRAGRCEEVREMCVVRGGEKSRVLCEEVREVCVTGLFSCSCDIAVYQCLSWEGMFTDIVIIRAEVYAARRSGENRVFNVVRGTVYYISNSVQPPLKMC